MTDVDDDYVAPRNEVTDIVPRYIPKRRQPRYEPLVHITEQQLLELLRHVPSALQDLVRGVYVRERVGRGATTERVYQKPPNIEAIKVILDRTLGKPTQRVDVQAEVNHTGRVGVVDMTTFSVSDRVKLLEIALEEQKKQMSAPEHLTGPENSV